MECLVAKGVVGVGGIGLELLTSASAVVRRCPALRGEVEGVARKTRRRRLRPRQDVREQRERGVDRSTDTYAAYVNKKNVNKLTAIAYLTK